MKKILFLFCFVLVLSLRAQQVESISFAELQNKILYTEAPLTIFNFWATWCKPCVQEMPYFDSVQSENGDVKVYFVSVDFKKDFDRIGKLVTNRNIQSEVLFLDEKDPDTFISKVSHDWSGAIPATLFVTDLGKTFFHEKAFTKEELEKTVKKYLN